ncbi:MAG: CHRD domain-containing protein [Novosphingobium sp.]
MRFASVPKLNSIRIAVKLKAILTGVVLLIRRREMRQYLIPLVTFSLMASLPAHAAIAVYTATLNGASEVPVNASAGIGTAVVTIDDVLNTMAVNVVFSGLTGTVTASHIHCCTALPFSGTAGVATVTPTFTGFPSGVTSGTYAQVFDLLAPTGTWNTAFITASGGTPAGAEAALIAGLNSGRSYLNIHTPFAPGGEIRGFLVPVPEPASWAMMLAGFGIIGGAMRLSRRRGYKVQLG